MRKNIFALLLIFCLTLSGCSSYSDDTYDDSPSDSPYNYSSYDSIENNEISESSDKDETESYEDGKTDDESGGEESPAADYASDDSGDGESSSSSEPSSVATFSSATEEISIALSDIPEYSGEPYVVINNNEPDFDSTELTTDSFETYSELDSLGRCGTAYACIGTDLMPTEERSSISSVIPTGWHSVTYDGIDGGYLYNRCHLIGYQLTAENANEKNLITGTRYLNVEGMLPFENMVADYIEETENHVLYRVTPLFDGDNLVASGVLIEAMSVEDEGDGILFCIYCYNIQPGIEIDYATGESRVSESVSGTAEESASPSSDDETSSESSETAGTTYILNTSTMKFHYPDCSSVSQMNESNKSEFTGDRADLIAQGYSPCGRCNP